MTETTDRDDSLAAPSWVVAVVSQKGGAGKSNLAMALAAAVADSAGRALVVDVDPQATTVDAVEEFEDPGYDVAHELDPAKLSKLSELQRHDTILVDCPGSLEGQDVLREVLDNSHYAIIPHVHEPFSYKPTKRTAGLIRETGTPFRVVLNAFDPRSSGDGVLKARQWLEGENLPYYKSVVREYKGYPNSLGERKTITQWKGKYAANMRQDISRVLAEMQRDLGRIAAGQAVS